MLKINPLTADGTIQRDLVCDLPSPLPQFLWIQAESGAGKTILARQLLGRDLQPVIWVRLEAAHGDLSHLIRAIACSYLLLPDAVDLQSPPRSLTDLFRHILSNHPKGICLALDNFEALEINPETRNSLARAVLDHLNAICLLVTCQTAPQGLWQRFASVPGFHLIPPEQLSFSETEVACLLSNRLGLPKEEIVAESKKVYALCHGWPAGASLLVEQMRQKPAAFRNQISNHGLYDYFATQILDHLDPDTAAALEILAYLPAMPSSVLKLLFTTEEFSRLDSFRATSSLLHKDFPGAAEGHQPCWRLNPMLQQSLIATPQREATQLNACLTVCVSTLFEHGHEQFALEVMLAHRDIERIADYLAVSGEQLLHEGRLVMLSRLLNCLPPISFEKAPPLKLFRGIHRLQQDPWSAIEDFHAVKTFAKALGHLDLYVGSWALLIEAIWFAWEQGRLLDPLIDELPELMQAVERAQRIDLEPLLTKGAFTALSLRQPDHPEFERWSERALVDFQGRAPRHEIVRRGTQLLIHLIYSCADRQRAEMVLQRVHQVHDSNSETAADHCSYYVVKASYDCWFSPDDLSAAAIATAGLTVTAKLDTPHWDALLINAALYRLGPTEDRTSIDNFIELLEQRIGPRSRGQDSGILYHFQAYRQWLDGDLDAADKTQRLAIAIVKQSEFVLAPVFFNPGLAAILHHKGDTAAALDLLDETIATAQRQNTLMAVFIAAHVKAAILFETQGGALAEDSLRHAYEIGARHGIMATPWVRKALRGQMADYALANGICPDYARALGTTPQQDQENDPASQRVTIRTLGIPDILRDGQSVLTSRKPQKVPLLAVSHLVAAADTGIRSERLIEALWPDAGEDAGRQRLKSLVYRLRKLLGDKDALCIEAGRLFLNHTWIEADAWVIEAAVGAGVEEQARAVQLYNGAFFDGYLSHPDLLLHRTYLEGKVIEMIENIGSQYLHTGHWREALNVYEDGMHRLGPHMELFDVAKQCLDQINDPQRLERFLVKWQPIFQDAYDLDIHSPPVFA